LLVVTNCYWQHAQAGGRRNHLHTGLPCKQLLRFNSKTHLLSTTSGLYCCHVPRQLEPPLDNKTNGVLYSIPYLPKTKKRLYCLM
jgi:hypothetical protein